VRSATEQASYWRDVGTVDSYWEANIDLTDIVPDLDLYDRDWPIWTYGEMTAPAKFVHDEDGRRGEAVSSLIAGGSHHLRRDAAPVAGVHRRASAFLRAGRLCGDPAGRGYRPRRASAQRHRRKAACAFPTGLVVGEDPDSTRAVQPLGKGRLRDHQTDDRQLQG
jgi:glucose-1-phosphate adenylyltransferase